MINAKDIRQMSLPRSAMGYKTFDVDSLLDDIVVAMESSEREIEDLKRKLDILSEKVKEYRENEDSIRVALVTAQCSADRILKEATEKSEFLESESKQKAEEIFSLSKEKAKDLLTLAKEKARQLLVEAKQEHDRLLGEATHLSENMAKKIREDCRLEIVKLQELKKRNLAFRKMLAQQYCEQFDYLKSGLNDNDNDMSEAKFLIDDTVSDAEIDDALVKAETETRESFVLDQVQDESAVDGIDVPKDTVADFVEEEAVDEIVIQDSDFTDDDESKSDLNNLFDIVDESENDQEVAQKVIQNAEDSASDDFSFEDETDKELFDDSEDEPEDERAEDEYISDEEESEEIEEDIDENDDDDNDNNNGLGSIFKFVN